jgi:hypothetical protein
LKVCSAFSFSTPTGSSFADWARTVRGTGTASNAMPSSTWPRNILGEIMNPAGT